MVAYGEVFDRLYHLLEISIEELFYKLSKKYSERTVNVLIKSTFAKSFFASSQVSSLPSKLYGLYRKSIFLRFEHT